MLHQLTARAIIRDWTEGSLDFDHTEHEVISSLTLCHILCRYSNGTIHCQIAKRDTKSFIINTSIEYSIVSQFTSFVAIEKREKVVLETTCN